MPLKKELIMPWDIQKLLNDIREEYYNQNLESYWTQEKDSVEAALLNISKSIDSERFTPKAVLGVGGSGIVVRFSDSKFAFVDRALKFPRPIPGKVRIVTDLFDKEIQYLAEIQHPRIVQIHDYNSLNDIEQYSSLPYYFMDCIDGDTSRQYIKKHPKELLPIIESLADILTYLHCFPKCGFAHLDVKPDNFVVTSEGRAIMIDLGTCKKITESEDTTTVACTRSFAHPELIRKLTADPSDDNRAKGDIVRSAIDPNWDLWAFALTILSWLGIDHQSGETEFTDVLQELEPYTRKYLFLLVARILAGPVCPGWLQKRVGLSSSFLESIPVKTAPDLLEYIGRLTGSVNTLDQIPQLTGSQTDTIQAAPSQHITVTAAVKKVIETRTFRRLNSITQLGMVSQVYPSAKHSRREHSLGTYANVCRMLVALYNDKASPLFRQLCDKSDISALLLTALFHDIGQFPLAHDLEEIDESIFNHDELTEAKIRGSWNKKKKGFKKVTFESLEPVFKEWGVTERQVLRILSARAKNYQASVKDKLLRSLLSGPIDADKLDYLLRDGRQLGLPYPNAIDVERLFACVTAVVIDRLEGGYSDIPTLGVQAKGKVTADFLTLARYAMFSQAYWHHAVRAQKAMLFRAVQSLLLDHRGKIKLRELRTDFVQMTSELPESLYLNQPSQNILFKEDTNTWPISGIGRGTDFAATDAAVLAWFHEHLRRSNLPEKVLIEGILTRRLFKRLWVVSKEMEPTIWDKIMNLWTKLNRDQLHNVAHKFEELISDQLSTDGYIDVTTMPKETASDRIDRATKGYVPWLLIDIPGSRPGSQVPLYYVLEGQRRSLRKDDRTVGDLQKSKIWDEYANNLLSAAGKIRIFCDPKLVDSVEASMEWRKGIDSLITALEQVSE
jgi:HD superfamily phosphohydrolase